MNPLPGCSGMYRYALGDVIEEFGVYKNYGLYKLGMEIGVNRGENINAGLTEFFNAKNSLLDDDLI